MVRSEIASLENVNAVNPTSSSGIVSDVSIAPPPRPRYAVPAFYNGISPAKIIALSDNTLTLGTTSAMCAYKEAMKHDFTFHLRLLEA